MYNIYYMNDKRIYPDWVEKHHTKGTSIKKINNSYYLYSVTSHYDKAKGYPVSEQKYIGRIDEKEGLVLKEKISFDLTKDRLYLLKDIFDLSFIDDENDRLLIMYLPLLKLGRNKWTPGKIDKSLVKVISKYFSYNEGVIYGKLQ